MDTKDYLPCLAGRHLQWLGNRKPTDNPLPLDFGLLKIHQKTDCTAGGPQIVEALRSVLAGEALHAFQFQHSASSTRMSAKYSPTRWPL